MQWHLLQGLLFVVRDQLLHPLGLIDAGRQLLDRRCHAVAHEFAT